MLGDLERRALKTVTGHAVRLCGGQENAVNVTSRIQRAAAFSDYANAALPERFCPIDIAVELDQFAGEPVILKAMARMIGHTLIALPRIAASDIPLGRVTGEAMKEVADVFATLGQQLQDGELTKREEAQLEIEIDQAVDKLLALKLQARAFAERGSP